MPTDRTAVTAYLPDDLEKCLTEYCESKGLTRTYKTGKTKPVFGTAIVEILEQYFKGDLPDDVPSNVLEETVQKEVEKRLGKSQTVSEDAIASVVEERLEKYHASIENALQVIYQRLEAVEAAPANLDATLAQKDLSTTDPTPPQPSPPVVLRKNDTDGGGSEAAPASNEKLLSTSDAYDLAKARGFEGSYNAFRQKYSDIERGKIAQATFDKFIEQVQLERVAKGQYRDLGENTPETIPAPVTSLSEDLGGDKAAPDNIGDNTTLSNQEMADHLGITRQALDERRKNKNYPDGYYPIKQGSRWTWVAE